MTSDRHVMAIFSISSPDGMIMQLIAQGTAPYRGKALITADHCAAVSVPVAACVCVRLCAGRRPEEVITAILHRSVAALRARPESNIRGTAR